MIMVRSKERVEFLTNILTGAIESGAYGWFMVDEYRWEDMGEHAYAVITEEDETVAEGAEPATYRIDFDVIVRGLQVIRKATMGPVKDHNGSLVLCNAVTEKRLFVAPHRRAEIDRANRSNGDDGDLDVIDYLAIVECGLFGRVVYA